MLVNTFNSADGKAADQYRWQAVQNAQHDEACNGCAALAGRERLEKHPPVERRQVGADERERVENQEQEHGSPDGHVAGVFHGVTEEKVALEGVEAEAVGCEDERLSADVSLYLRKFILQIFLSKLISYTVCKKSCRIPNPGQCSYAVEIRH